MAVMLSIIIYRSAVKKEDLSYSVKKFWIGFAIFILYPLIYAIIIGEVAHINGYTADNYSCAPNNFTTSIIAMCQCFVAVLLLIFFYWKHNYIYIQSCTQRKNYKNFESKLITRSMVFSTVHIDYNTSNYAAYHSEYVLYAYCS